MHGQTKRTIEILHSLCVELQQQKIKECASCVMEKRALIYVRWKLSFSNQTFNWIGEAKCQIWNITIKHSTVFESFFVGFSASLIYSVRFYSLFMNSQTPEYIYPYICMSGCIFALRSNNQWKIHIHRSLEISMFQWFKFIYLPLLLLLVVVVVMHGFVVVFFVLFCRFSLLLIL